MVKLFYWRMYEVRIRQNVGRRVMYFFMQSVACVVTRPRPTSFIVIMACPDISHFWERQLRVPLSYLIRQAKPTQTFS